MKIPKFLDDLSVISKLGDNPGADNGLTAEGLKAKFDEAGLKLQIFLNETLIEKINSLFSLDAPPHEGMNMTGPINMNKNKLGGLADPAEDGDAVNLKFANKSYRAASWMPTIEEIGAAPVSHSTDKNNPHGVTAAQVGAAPAGYGYGGTIPDMIEVSTDDALKTALDNLLSKMQNFSGRNVRFFHTGPQTVNGVQGMGGQGALYGSLYKHSDSYAILRVFGYLGYAFSLVKTSTWGEVEWVNPPMSPGVEYRTTARIGDKAVYKKNVNGVIQYRLDGETTWHNYSVVKTKLWQNASRTSSFSPQTISVDLSGYDEVEVYYCLETEAEFNKHMVSSICPVGESLFATFTFGSASATYSRGATTNASGVTFSTGYQSGSASNASLVPYRIFGIKGVK